MATRYYFDIRDGNEFAVDEEGLELSNVRAVQAEAAKSLAEMARDMTQTSSALRRYMAIEVRDNSGPVMQVKFTFEVEKLKE